MTRARAPDVWLAPLLAFALGGCALDPTPAEHHSYRPNSVLDVPAEGDIADPDVIKLGATWYLYATNAPHELLAWTSTDLEHWEAQGAVWQPTPGTWNDGVGVWAPHVAQENESSFYLYISANSRIGVAHSSSPLGPFVDVLDHPLVGNGYGHVGNGIFGETPLDYDERAIDAYVLQDDDGSLTLFYSAYAPLSNIYAAPMLDFTTLADVEPTLLISPDKAWEGAIAEGTWVEKHDGRYVLMYSGNIYLGPNYAIGAAESDAPLGPYEKYPDNPLLATNIDAGFISPGHNSVAPGWGSDRLMFFHTKADEQTGANRRLRYAPISYDADGRLDLLQP